MKATSRINPGTGKKQWLTPELLRTIWEKLPADAYAMLAVTMTDLYPDESWNFVFGQALPEKRVGVFSFARYHPAWSGGKSDDSTKTLVLRRALKVLTHEMGHMFGIEHCVHFQCNMNGCNSLQEADSTPMDLCPVCLRKLHHAIRFDPVKRYEKMRDFDAANGLDNSSQSTVWSARSSTLCAAVSAMLAAAFSFPTNGIYYDPLWGPNSNSAAHYIADAGNLILVFNNGLVAPPGAIGWNVGILTWPLG